MMENQCLEVINSLARKEAENMIRRMYIIQAPAEFMLYNEI